MQVTAQAVIGADDVARRGHGRTELLALDHADAVVAMLPMQGRDLLAQLAFLSRLDRDMHLPFAQVAVDGVAGDELALQAQPFDGDVPDALCVGGADQRLQFVLPTGDTRDRLRAAAS